VGPRRRPPREDRWRHKGGAHRRVAREGGGLGGRPTTAARGVDLTQHVWRNVAAVEAQGLGRPQHRHAGLTRTAAWRPPGQARRPCVRPRPGRRPTPGKRLECEKRSMPMKRTRIVRPHSALSQCGTMGSMPKSPKISGRLPRRGRPTCRSHRPAARGGRRDRRRAVHQLCAACQRCSRSPSACYRRCSMAYVGRQGR
jgi:hypothetical protein